MAQDGLVHADLLNVEIQEVAVAVQRRTTDHRQVELELTDGLCRQVAHQTAIGAAQLAAGQEDLAPRVRGKDVGHVHVVGDDHQVLVMEQFLRHGFGRGPDAQKQRDGVGHLFGAGQRDGALGLAVERPPFAVFDVGRPRGQDRAAVHPFQPPGFGEVGQVAADGLQGHAEMRGQPVHGDLAVAADDVENLRMAECLGHVRFFRMATSRPA